MLQLKNSYLTVDIEAPEEGYIGSRFDQLGKIVQITSSDGFPFLTIERLNSEPYDSLGKGLFGEFGIDKPIGYEVCPIGHFFPKPGVGMLKKVSHEPYDFFFKYERIPFDVTIDVEQENTILFTSRCNDINYPFIYQKRLTLLDNAVIVGYQFTNLGKSEIRSNEYLHNFIALSSNSLNHFNSSLDFAGDVNNKIFLKGLNPNSVVKYSTHNPKRLTLTGLAPSDIFFNDLVDIGGEPQSWVFNCNSNNSCSEIVDFVPEKVNLWGASHVISPEIFISLNIKGGEQVSWQRAFEFNSTTN